MNQTAAETIQYDHVPLSCLNLNPDNARRFEDNPSPAREAKLAELVASIEVSGILQPLIVRHDEGGQYRIIAGERRFRAARELCARQGLAEEDFRVPVAVQTVDDEQAQAIMLAENACREDLTPLEQARGFQAYLDRVGDTPDAVLELSRRTGVAVPAIRRSVALLALPQPVLEAWQREELTQGHVEQLTRLSDEKDILEALTACLRGRMTVKELQAHLLNQRPSLGLAYFDKTECAACPHNSGVQRGLFVDTTDKESRCLKLACFEARQQVFMEQHWHRSKAKELLGTNGFRFAHNVTVNDRIPLPAEPKERCQSCPEFVSVTTLNAKAVKGLERCCVGKRECFDDLYVAKTKPAPAKADDQAAPAVQPRPGKKAAGKAVASAPAAGREPEEAVDPKRAAKRGEEHREAFFKAAIPAKVATLPPNEPTSVRLALLGLALASTDAKKVLTDRLGINDMADKDTLAEALFALDTKELLPTLQLMALAPIMSGMEGTWGSTSSPALRKVVAERIGIDLAQEFALTESYLKAMTKTELVRMGEEPRVDLWGTEEIVRYREEHHKGKALHSLKKSELIEMILTSGVALTGRTPGEIL